MKNYLLLTASAVLVLSSCSNNEIIETKDVKNGEATKMSISAYVPGMTRGLYDAQEADADSLKKYGFALLTSQVNEDYEMFRTQMAFNSENNVWGPASGEAEPAWPSDPNEEVKFYGVYPPEAVGEDGLEIVVDGGYALPFEGSADQDLMIAYTSKSLAASNNGNVQLDFSHVLAKVEVKFVGTQEGYNYEVGAVNLTAKKATEYRFGSGFSVPETENDTTYKLDNIDGISIGKFQKNDVDVTGNTVTANETLDYAKLLVVPGQCTLDLCYGIALPDSPINAKELPDNNKITFNAVAGRRNIVIISLTPSSKAMTFTVNVTDWEDNDENTEEEIEL